MKHFKQFFVFALLALFSVSMWADEVTFAFGDYKGEGTTSSGSAYTMSDKDDVTIGDTKFYGNNSYAHFYANGVTTITPATGVTITQVVINASATNYNGYQSSGTMTWSTGSSSADGTVVTWTGSATAAFTLSHNKQIRWTSIVVTYSKGSGTPTCATPTFSPEAGSYEGTQNVTISSTAGATIYYTTDESDPKTSATKQTYSSAISVSADMTIKAYAVKTDYNDSEVATAAYVITEGPDVTINLLDDGWGFPTSKVVDETAYTNGDYTIKVAGTTGQGFRTYGTYFMLGQNGAYLELPAFANPIERIVVAGNSNGSAAVTWNIYKGDDAVSTAATGCKNDAYTFEIDEPEASVVYRIKVTSSANLQIKTIKIYYGTAAAVAKPTISGDENFVGSTTVTLDCSTTGAEIYYTTDGTDPKSGTLYSAPFSLTADATVKAIAKLGSDWSQAAEKNFTKVTPMTTAAELRTFATSSNQTAFIQLDGWKVTFVSGNYVYIIDPSNEGVILNNAGHGYVAGDELNDEVVEATIKLSNGRVQLSGFTSTNITATAGTVSPVEVTDFSTVLAVNQSRLITLKDATYASAAGTFSDGANVIYYYDQFGANPTLVDGASYDVTGIVIYYDNGSSQKVELAPREATDVVSKGAVVIPTAANLAALKAAERGTYILTLTNAVVSYVNGKNVFIEEGTTGALIFLNTHSYEAGNCLNGDYQVTTEDYQGKFEITAIEPQAGAATTTAAIPLTTLTIAQLNAGFASYESRRIKIEGVNVTDALTTSDRNGVISDGVNTVALYAGVASTIAVELNANIDIIGYPGFHNTDEQLTVWANEDITVNVKEDPELAYDPVSETIEQGASWSAPTLTNPHSLTISSYASDNESVATVTDAGVIALAGGLGTAVITAHFNGDATYNAGNATYTITVEEADARNKATGSAFTEISGNLTPADITFAAYKGDGTTTPVINSSNIRLYKPASGKSTGSYLTVKAKVGCTIDQVKITFAGAATAAYSVDDAALPTDAFITGQTELLTAASLNAQSVSIVNLKNGSIDVSEIKVWYTGSPLSIDHYFLGGTYETTFEQNGTFDYTGLEVYAAYDAGETITEPVEGFTVEADLSTAGAAKANVMLNSVKIAEYDITVTAGKEDPALAYSPVSETITAGDAWSAPTLSNTFNVTPITYSSDKESVATVTSEGVITLAGGYGTAVITAHFDATAAYIESEATYTITVNKPAPTPTSTVYRKVTATADITDGEYLIVYEGDATHDAAVFDGSLDNDNIDVAMKALPVEIVSDEIAGNTDLDAATFTIDVTAGTLQSASGLYIGRTANSNGMDKSTTETYANTFAIAEGEAVISVAAGPTIRYNYANDQLRFRYYKSGQQAIQLYKKETATPPTPDYTEVRTGLEIGRHYTICMPKNITEVRGGTFWSMSERNTDGDLAYLVEAIAPFDAGKPYIFKATAATLEVVYGDENAATPVDNGALRGTFDYMSGADLEAQGNVYLLISNTLVPIDHPTTNFLNANRAYVDYDALTAVSEPSHAPGRRVVAMPMHKDVTTGMDELNASETPVKVLINGQLYILRGEKMYNANGQLVK